jgi:SAM-dependent methyltransferase
MAGRKGEVSWAPSPSYLLRRWTVLRELRGIRPGRLVEIGCGAGDLLASLKSLGFDAACVETSARARAEAAARFAGGGVPLVTDLAHLEGTFDLIIACEVLEHIEDDLAALRTWTARLAPGGHALLTVPAHPGRFGPSDVWAGHHRRYRRDQLQTLARAAGLSVSRLLCFGFPLGNLVEPVRARVHARRLRREAPAAPAQRTARSGVERGIEARLAPFLSPWLILPFCWLQQPFLHTDFGTGYLLLGRRT